MSASGNGKNKKKSSNKRFLCFKKSITWEQMEDRAIIANEECLQYNTNKISTSKYNAFNFLPKNLFYQFSKLANCYFVLIGCLQLIKEISTSGGMPYIFIPLSFILIVSAIKDLIEDLKRHSSDNEENNKKTKIFHKGKFVQCKWSELRVGNIIKIDENEYFPADILLLNSSGKKGICYIETKNLDGETNLKSKIAHNDIQKDCENEEKILHFNAEYKYEKPNPYLYTFVGNIFTSSGQVSLNEQNFILRGCSLRNTKYVYGLVSYTGHDTKIMLNSIKGKSKFSKLELQMNRQIILVFIVQFAFCFFSGMYNAIWYSVKSDELGYLLINRNSYVDNNFAYNLFVRLGNWLLIFTNFVPISLLVTLELVKVIQGMTLSKDKEMMSKETKTYTTVQSSNLNEELGQVEYIFSDKTGTLTCNLMEFKNICIGGISYGENRGFKKMDRLTPVTNVDFADEIFFADFWDKTSENRNNIIECLKCLSICHTIITEERDGKLIFNASSPDELALVNFAKYVGCEYNGTDENNNLYVNLEGSRHQYKILNTLEFNSKRKRMSLIVKDKDNRIILYTKGADSIILERLSSNNNDPIVLTETMKHLNQYAVKGLRTLLLGKRIIEPSVYTKWAEKYKQASCQISHREEAMEELQAEIEVDLTLVGATAVEDKLQDNVGMTIRKLKEAGIKVWVLTGDKVETAINIGYSCELLNDSLKKLEIIQTKPDDIRKKIEEYIRLIEGASNEHTNFALIVSGEALVFAMHLDYTKKLMKIADKCGAVLACRVSPKQKQEIVTLVRREKPKVTTLAIGDGANDVNMITAAHVGIGIRGVEGQQAARASDFAIGEFKLLHRLLFVFGRECYRRNSTLVLYNFYKNLCVVLPQFWFAFANGFSGQTIYDQLIFQFYNILYTSVPIMIYAIFDEEKPDYELLDKAYNYVQGIKNRLFNNLIFWKWFFNGCVQAAIIAWFSFLSFDNYFSDQKNGRSYGFWEIGMAIFCAIILVTNIKILLFSNTYHVLSIFFICGSILVYIFTVIIASYIQGTQIHGSITSTWECPYFYFCLFLIIVTSNMLEWAMSSYQNIFLFDKSHVSYIKALSYEEKNKRKHPHLVELPMIMQNPPSSRNMDVAEITDHKDKENSL